MSMMACALRGRQGRRPARIEAWPSRRYSAVMPSTDVGAVAALSAFVGTPLERLLDEHTRRDPAVAALELFRGVVRDVPAYRAFLAERAFDPAKVRSPEDLRHVPATSKDEYLRRHPLPTLCRHGRLEACDMVA